MYITQILIVFAFHTHAHAEGFRNRQSMVTAAQTISCQLVFGMDAARHEVFA